MFFLYNNEKCKDVNLNKEKEVFNKRKIIKRKNISITHIFNDNLLIKYNTIEINKFKESIENNYKPCFIENNIKLLKIFKKMEFSYETKKILYSPNAGGNSVLSEVFSFEILKIAFGATLHKTELEIEYFPYGSKITDYIANINGKKIGVSVTRAINYFNNYTVSDAKYLLSKKLDGIYWSTKNVVKNDKWKKQILHVFCQSSDIINIIKTAYRQLPSNIKGNTIVIVSDIDLNELFFCKKTHLKNYFIDI